jgi:membrane-associated phospholipid phosphatase
MRVYIFCILILFSIAGNTSNKESVYKINPLVDGLLIGVTSLGVSGAYYDSDALIHTRCPCDVNEINSFDRPVVGNHDENLDRLSDVTVAAAVAIPVIADGMDLGLTKEFGEDALVYIESLTINATLVTLAKYQVQRPLPLTYEGEPSLINSPRGYRSFYSGHTSTTFAALTSAAYTYNLRNGPHLWPWITTGLVGTSVAYERIQAGKHFYTDVIVGAAVGTGIGFLVPWLHSRHPDQTVTFVPHEDGIHASWTKRF